MGRSSEMISLCQRARQRLYFRQSHRSSDLQLEQVLLASLGLVPEQILVWLFWVSKRILYVMKLHRSVWLPRFMYSPKEIGSVGHCLHNCQQEIPKTKTLVRARYGQC